MVMWCDRVRYRTVMRPAGLHPCNLGLRTHFGLRHAHGAQGTAVLSTTLFLVMLFGHRRQARLCG